VELKRKVASGFVWHSVEKLAGTAFHTVVSLLLARMLTPADFGLVGMLVIFSAVSLALFDSGFSQALIRKENATESDYTSVLYINIAGAVTIYAILVVCSPLISEFYRQPELTLIAPVFFLSIPISAIGSVHGAILFRQMKFRLSAIINLAAAVISAAAALTLAVLGYGVWAIVVQIILRDMVRVLLLWLFGGWLPKGRSFSRDSIRGLFGFGGGMMVSGVLTQLSSNTAQLFIGRIYSPTALGLFHNSQKLKDTFVNVLEQSISNVTFPALSTIQDDTGKLCEASRKVMAVMSFAMFPLLGGLIVTAEDIFLTILTDKWLEAIPYFRLFCLSAFALPAGAVALNILKARGRGRLIMNIEMAKRTVMLLIIIATVYIGVMAVVVGVVAYAYLEAMVNLLYARCEIGIKRRSVTGAALPSLLLTAVMCASIMLIGLLPLSVGVMLLIKVITGATLYIGLAALLRIEVWSDICAILADTVKNNR